MTVPLDAPRDGVPPVVADPRPHSRDRRGPRRRAPAPVAVDAERASGHRYGQRAFLVQLRREGAGTALIDPGRAAGSSASSATRSPTPSGCCTPPPRTCPAWPTSACARRSLFDTELASRLAGLARVGLAAVVEQLLGLGLAKEHSAVDWSIRPLPEPWLRYAALDVEVLIELRDALADELDAAGQAGVGARGVRRARRGRPTAARVDPWRRTSGHAPGPQPPPAGRRPRAVERARRPGPRARRLPRPDRCRTPRLVEAALAQPTTLRERWRPCRLHRPRARAATRDRWHDGDRPRAGAAGVRAAAAAPADRGPAAARIWADRDPAAAARLARARARVAAIAAGTQPARWRTCSPPTPSAGSPGRRRSRPTRTPSADPARATAPAPGRSSSRLRCSPRPSLTPEPASRAIPRRHQPLRRDRPAP